MDNSTAIISGSISIVLIIILILLVVFSSQFDQLCRKLEASLAKRWHRYIKQLPNMPAGVLKSILTAMLGAGLLWSVRAMVVSDWATNTIIVIFIFLIICVLWVMEAHSARIRKEQDEEFVRQMKITIKEAVKEGIKETEKEGKVGG